MLGWVLHEYSWYSNRNYLQRTGEEKQRLALFFLLSTFITHSKLKLTAA